MPCVDTPHCRSQAPRARRQVREPMSQRLRGAQAPPRQTCRARFATTPCLLPTRWRATGDPRRCPCRPPDAVDPASNRPRTIQTIRRTRPNGNHYRMEGLPAVGAAGEFRRTAKRTERRPPQENPRYRAGCICYARTWERRCARGRAPHAAADGRIADSSGESVWCMQPLRIQDRRRRAANPCRPGVSGLIRPSIIREE